MKPFSVGIACVVVLGLLASGAVQSCRAAVLAGSVDPLQCSAAPKMSLRALVDRPAPSARGSVARVSHAGLGQATMAMFSAESDEDRAARIHPGVAFLMSAVLPGSGQLAEGRNRAFAYLGIEAISWIAHFSWLDAGNKKEGEYEAYARGHWDFASWDSLAAESNPNCQAIPPNVQYDDARTTLLAFIEAGNYQHYYEDIGKLEAYRGGWDDFDCASPDEMSPNRRHYRSMREDSNNYLDRARNAMTVVFLNHVISAVDAYRTAKGVRMTLPGGAEMKFRVSGSPHSPRVGVRVSKSW